MNPNDTNNFGAQSSSSLPHLDQPGNLPGSGSVADAMASFGQTPLTVQSNSLPTIATNQTAPMAASGPDLAADRDIIEKTWVKKAEQIVARTRLDPYTQAKALNALKADYINKRYGKQVQVVEE